MDEDAWKEAFQNELIIRGILHFWSLEIEDCFQKNPNWLQYTLCSFARFCCQLCGRSWASSKVHLLFQIKLKKKIGRVKMHIFKQKCKICNSGCYENPMFIPENIEIAMRMLFNRICERIYNIPKESMPSRSFIKDGRQDGPHDCSNCEACAHGICTRNRNEAFNPSNVAYYEEFQRAFHGTDWERGTSHRALLRNHRNTQQNSTTLVH
ncbi:receptor-transporting protein 3-like [Leptodactylus fuscus]